jgi:hypothetical protein
MIDNRAEFCWSLIRKTGGRATFCIAMGILTLAEVIHTNSDNVAACLWLTNRKRHSSQTDCIQVRQN